jgi:hypothetical protein
VISIVYKIRKQYVKFKKTKNNYMVHTHVIFMGLLDDMLYYKLQNRFARSILSIIQIGVPYIFHVVLLIYSGTG